MFIWTPLRGRLPKERLPQKTFCPGGILAKKIFPQEAFVQERPSLPRRPFSQEDVYLFGTIVQRHLCNKGHPNGKACGLEQSADKTEIRHLVIVLREILTLQTKSSYEIFCS